MPLILIIASNLSTRSLLGAQLKEEGFEALGAAALDEAVLLLGKVGEPPSLVVMDTQELEIEQKAFDLLALICAEVPLLLIHGAWDKPAQLKWKARVHELAKPRSIGEIVAEVKKMLVD